MELVTEFRKNCYAAGLWEDSEYPYMLETENKLRVVIQNITKELEQRTTEEPKKIPALLKPPYVVT